MVRSDHAAIGTGEWDKRYPRGQIRLVVMVGSVALALL